MNELQTKSLQGERCLLPVASIAETGRPIARQSRKELPDRPRRNWQPVFRHPEGSKKHIPDPEGPGKVGIAALFERPARLLIFGQADGTNVDRKDVRRSACAHSGAI